MTIMKILMMLVAATTTFCRHHQAIMAKEVAMIMVDEENEAAACSASDQQKVKKCMFSTTSIDECCPTFKSILGTSCSCYKYAEDLDNQVLITLQAYCDVGSPCKGVPPPPPKSPPPPPANTCPVSDQDKLKKCMFEKTSIDKCCPTFKSILMTSCPCYKYAEDLDNQVLITLEVYCDVSNPCKGVPSPPPPPSKSPPPAPEAACPASNQDKLKKCMLQTIVTDECCPTFKSILMHSCPCYKYAEKFDNQAFITLRAYCDVGNPCKSAQSPPPPPPKLPPPTPATTCPASNQDKLKKCMLQTIVTDECCLTFKSILMHSCPCYKYAEKFDDRTFITLKAYCDVGNPCKSAQSPPPPPPKLPPPTPATTCPASNQDKLKKCMLQTIVTDECCLTFKSILMHSCPCYKYAEKFDDRTFITLKAYCDVGNPCKSAQVIKLSNDE
ncbi:hypothetical protein P3S67_005635 [Capsicum chacoense]